MKILHVTKKYPNAMGGDAVVVANLQKQQEAAGHQVAILTSNCSEIMDGAHIYKCGLKDTPAALDNITLRRLISLVILFFKAFGVLRRERPDVIHTFSVDMAFAVSFAAQFYEIPVVHAFLIVTFYDEHQSLLRRKSELLLAKGARLRAATAPNVYDVRKLQEAGLKQVSLLPNGVDIAFWKPKKTPARKPNAVFTFMTVGRLEQQKGYDYLVKAAVQLAQLSPMPFRFVIAGEGGQKTALMELATSLGVERAIEFVGRKTAEEIRALAAESDAAVVSSLYETTPITLLEAWAAKLPVVATPVGILHDASAETRSVYVAQIKDEISLADAMLRCMNDAPKRAKVAAEGYKEAQQYAWPAIAQTVNRLYEGLA
jgi:glycosyltransferase involved in cell wall biosynthesis